MKRILKLLAFCVALTATVMAQLPSAWQNWRYSMALDLTSVSEPQLTRVILPKQVLGHSQQSFADLRLIDDAGGETGYVVHARRGRRSRQWRQTQISDTGFVAGRYTQAVLDTGIVEGHQHYRRASSWQRQYGSLSLAGSPVIGLEVALQGCSPVPV